MKTLEVVGVEYPSVSEAVQGLSFHGDHAVSLGGKCLTITESEMARLNALGLQPTTWHYCEVIGRIVCVPGND